MSSELSVAIAGLGTVGVGTFKILQDQLEMLSARSGKKINIVAVSSRDKNKDRGINISGITWYDDAILLADIDDVDVIIELIGGDSGIAYDLCKKAIQNGKHVVTANKALMAKHGFELASLAEEKDVSLKFEAAVAGGIPVIKSLKEGLVANNIKKISGILNGTGNYILTKMKETGQDFSQILKEAQELGYAEADPSFDIDGIDTAHKLAILSSIAFSTKVDFSSVYVQGIRHISLLDITYATELGYKIKLLGICYKVGKKICQYVYPAFVPLNYPIAKVDGVNNAVYIEGDSVGKVVLEGPGAGAFPTASSVVADIVDIASNREIHSFSVPSKMLKDGDFNDIDNFEGEYYIRITVKDEAGVLARITDALAANNVSMDTILQKTAKNSEQVNIVGLTHVTKEIYIKKSVKKIEKLQNVLAKIQVIRIESD